jgi:biopolymer transport protein ExbD
MKSLLGASLIVLAMSSVVAAQNPAAPVLQQQGVQVQMPVSSRAVAMPDADRADATVVTVTAEGELYSGADPIQVAALAGVPGSTVYVKADAGASYQKVLTVLSALKGRQLVLLTEATVKAAPGKITPPYGVPLALGRQ